MEKVAEISLMAKNKLGFVTGKCARPIEDETQIALWERCNNLVISWLLHSVETDISNKVLYCKTSSEIWTELGERFALSNAPRLYQVHQDLVTTVQGGNSIDACFTQLKTS